MGINITTGYQFENKENLRNTAKNILNRQGVSAEAENNIMEKAVFDYSGESYANAQLAILKASSQISLSSSLKETLKYLKSHPVKRVEKEPVLGELWNLLNSQEDDENSLNDIIELEIDYSAENIFAAA